MQTPSSKHVDTTQPWWSDYLPFLTQLAGTRIPGCGQLNSMLPAGLRSEAGKPIQFVSSTELEDGAYEQRIYTTGQVSTRAGNWHDYFNALVWMRFPLIKIAMNTLHYHAWSEQNGGSRGRLRDALTLFDECGAIVCSSQRTILDALAQRRWIDAFSDQLFQARVHLSICGHAMLEKYLSPYKSMTANVLLFHVESDFLALPRQEMLAYLDTEIANRMLKGKLMTKPACLAPLPLAGVPGWWSLDEQNNEFYDDPGVFRLPSPNLQPAAVINL